MGKEDATQADLERAVEIAQAADFIAKTPDGFDARLAEGGTNFLVVRNNGWRSLVR